MDPTDDDDDDATQSTSTSKRTRLTWDQIKGNMDTIHRSFLIQRIHQLEAKCAKQDIDLKAAKKKQRTTVAENKKLEKQLQLQIQKAGDQTDEQILCVEKTTKAGKQGKRFSSKGYVALGIRKSLSVTSAVGFPLAALVDVSRQTVTRSETAVWAMLTTRSAAFHVAMRRNLRMVAGWFNSWNESTNESSNTDPPDNTQVAAFAVAASEECISHEVLVERDLGLNPDPDGDRSGISGAEEYFLHAATPDYVVRTFLATFATGEYNAYLERNAQRQDQSALEHDVDELGLEEAAEYRSKVTKWIKGSLLCLQDTLFWFLLQVSFMSRSPFRHMFAILSKYSGHASSRIRNPCTDCEAHELPIVDLVTVRLAQLDDEFHDLRNNIPCWCERTLASLQGMICWDANHALLLEDLQHMAMRVVMLNHASYKRVARELLDSSEQVLECTTRKIRTSCWAELEEVAVTGRLRMNGRLRASLLLSASMLRLDVQELESLNSMVKHQVARSGNNRITLELLSSRVLTRKLLALHAVGWRYKDVVPVAAAFAKSAYLQHGPHKEYLADEARWHTCGESRLTPADPAVYNPAARPTPEHSWALKYNATFMKAVRAHNKDHSDTWIALLVPTSLCCDHQPADEADEAEFERWICCGVTRSQAMLFRQEPGGATSSFMLSAQLIAKLHSRVAEKRHHNILYIQEVSMPGAVAAGAVQELCRLRARYQRAERTDPLDDQDSGGDGDDRDPDGIDDDADMLGDDVDENMPGSQGQETNRLDNEQLMRLLLGLDDFGDEGNDEDDVDDMAELEGLNVKIAATAADMKLPGMGTKVEGRHDELLAAEASSVLAPVDQETEAFLQELFVNGLGQTSINEDEVHSSSLRPDVVTDQGDQASGAATQPRTVDDDDAKSFWQKWQAAMRMTCEALQHRDRECTRPLGDNSIRAA
ncbi:unnamed protein product [Symbiodinium sp. CCMP2592]|nr:unnamed protein product [Symbiodinium sp. CCMP2592]